MSKNKIMKIKRARSRNIDPQISKLIQIEQALKRLPPMTDLQRAKFENGMAIDHLYYSSKIEGTHLSKERIDKAIYGQGVSQAQE